MAYKVYTDNNYFVIENTSNNNRIEVSEPKSNVRSYVQDGELKVRLYSNSNFDLEFPFSQLVDSNGSAWGSVSALQTWLRTNTGFNTASGGSGATGNTSTSQLISGGYYLVEDYDYFVWYDNAIVNGTTLTNYTSDTVTLSAADGSNDRFDTIVINSDGTISVEEGTAATNPELPFIDTNTQLAVVTIRVTASSTTQAGVTTVVAYDEDLGTGGGEWDTTNSANVNTASTEQANSGTKSIKFTSAATDNFATLTGGASRDGNDLSLVKFDIYLPSSANYRYLLQFRSEDDTTTSGFTLVDGLYGFSQSTVNSWQTIVIPKEAFPGIAGITYNEFSIINKRNNTTAFFENIIFQEGTVSVATPHPDYTLNVDGGDLQLLKDGEVHSVIAGGAGATTVTVADDITTNTTISGTQKGLNTVYPVNNSADRTITVDKGTYAVGDVINFMRKGAGAVTIDRGTNVRLQGARNVDNVFNIKDVGGYASIVFEYLDDSTLVGSVLGDIERGYTGAVTTSSYSNIESNETADVEVAGTGFSDNMVVTLSGNATLNTVTVNSPTSATLNITSSGTDGDLLTITYDNGQVFVDTDCIELNDIAPISVVMTTTSTSSTWSPTTVTNSGATLRWTVTGGTSGVYDANDPTIDLSGNVGTATITVTSADDLAGWTTCRFTSLALTSLDVSNWTACTELWVFGNSGLTSITGTQNLTNATVFDLRVNNLSSINTTGLTGLQQLKLDSNSSLSSVDISTNTGLTTFQAPTCALTSLNVTNNTSLTTIQVNTNPSLSSITGLSSRTGLTTLSVAACGFTTLSISTLTALASLNCSSNSGLDTIDISANTGLKTISIQACSLDVSTINNVILDRYANGVLTGTRTMNYSAQSPTANPTATESVSNDVLDAYNALVSAGWTITGTAPS